jgi:hypothetical protein
LTPQLHRCEKLKAFVALGNVYISWTERDEFLLIHQNLTLTAVIITVTIVVIVVRCYAVLLAVLLFCDIMIGLQIAEGKRVVIKGSLEPV